jgi:hypothetical protein
VAENRALMIVAAIVHSGFKAGISPFPLAAIDSFPGHSQSDQIATTTIYFLLFSVTSVTCPWFFQPIGSRNT